MHSQLESAYWYTVIDPVTLKLTLDKPGQFRAKILSRGLGDVIGQLEMLLARLKAKS